MFKAIAKTWPFTPDHSTMILDIQALFKENIIVQAFNRNSRRARFENCMNSFLWHSVQQKRTYTNLNLFAMFGTFRNTQLWFFKFPRVRRIDRRWPGPQWHPPKILYFEWTVNHQLPPTKKKRRILDGSVFLYVHDLKTEQIHSGQFLTILGGCWDL